MKYFAGFVARFCGAWRLAFLAAATLSASSSQSELDNRGGFLYSDYLRTAAADGVEIGSFSVRINRPGLWVGGEAAAKRVGNAIDALPLSQWAADYYLKEEAALSSRFANRVAAAGWNLAAKAADEAILSATEESFRRGFIRNIEVDLQSALGGRFAHAGLNALGALRETEEDAIVWQLRGFVGGGRSGANAGLIYRRDYKNVLLGANVFGDFEVFKDEEFWRWSLGAEFRSAWADFFANYYVSASDAIFGETDGVRTATYTAGGYDARLHIHSPDLPWLVGVAEYYSWEGEYGAENEDGYRAGFRLRPSDFPAYLEVLYQDGEDGENIGAKVGVNYRFGEEEFESSGGVFRPRDWFFRPAEREYSQRIRTEELTLPLLYRVAAVAPRGGSFTIENEESGGVGSTLTVTDIGGVSLSLDGLLRGAPYTQMVEYGADGWQVPLEPMTLKTIHDRVTLRYATGASGGVLGIGSTVGLTGLTAYLIDGAIALQAFGFYEVVAPPTVAGGESLTVMTQSDDVAFEISVDFDETNNTATGISVNYSVGEIMVGAVMYDCDSDAMADGALQIGKNCRLETPALFLNGDYAAGETALSAGISGNAIDVRYLETRTPYPADGGALATISVRGGDGSATLSAGVNPSLAFDAAGGELRLAAGAFSDTTITATLFLTVAATETGGDSASLILTVRVDGYPLSPISASFAGDLQNGDLRAVNAFFNASLAVATLQVSGGVETGGYNYNFNADNSGIALDGTIVYLGAQAAAGGVFPFTVVISDVDPEGRTADQALSLVISVAGVEYPPVTGDIAGVPSGAVMRADESLGVIGGGGGGGAPYRYSLVGDSANIFELSVATNGDSATLYFANGRLPSADGVYVARIRIAESVSGLATEIESRITVNAPPALALEWAGSNAYNDLSNHDIAISGGRLTVSHIETIAPNSAIAFATVSFVGGSGNAVLSRIGGGTLDFDANTGAVNLADGIFGTGANDGRITLTVRAADSQIGATITAEFTVAIIGESLEPFAAVLDRFSHSGDGTQASPLRVTGNFQSDVNIAALAVGGGLQPYTITRMAGGGLVANIDTTTPTGLTLILPQQTTASFAGEVRSATLMIDDSNTDANVQGGTPQIVREIYARIEAIIYPALAVVFSSGELTGGGTQSNRYETNRRNAALAMISASGGSGRYRYTATPGNIFEMDGNVLRFAQSGGRRILPPAGNHFAEVRTETLDGNDAMADGDTIRIYFNIGESPVLDGAVVPNSAFNPGTAAGGLRIMVSGESNVVTVMIDVRDGDNVASASLPPVAIFELTPADANLNINAPAGEVVSYNAATRAFSLDGNHSFYAGAVSSQTVILTATVALADDPDEMEVITASIAVMLTPVPVSAEYAGNAAVNTGNGDGGAGSEFGPVMRSDLSLAVVTGAGGTGTNYNYALINGADNIFELDVATDGSMATVFFAGRRLPSAGGFYVATTRIEEPTSGLSAIAEARFMVNTPPVLALEWAGSNAYNDLSNHDIAISGGRLTVSHIETIAPNSAIAFATVSFAGGSGNAVLSRIGGGTLDFDANTGAVNLADGVFGTGANDGRIILTVRAADSQIGATITAEFTVAIIGESLEPFAAEVRAVAVNGSVPPGDGTQASPFRVTGSFDSEITVATLAVSGGLPPYTISSSGALNGIVSDSGTGAVVVLPATAGTGVRMATFTIADNNTDANVQSGTPAIALPVYVNVAAVQYPPVSSDFVANVFYSSGGRDGVTVPFGPVDRGNVFLAEVTTEGGDGAYAYSLINGSGDIFALSVAAANNAATLFFNNDILPAAADYTATVRVFDSASNLTENVEIRFEVVEAAMVAELELIINSDFMPANGAVVSSGRAREAVLVHSFLQTETAGGTPFAVGTVVLSGGSESGYNYSVETFAVPNPTGCKMLLSVSASGVVTIPPTSANSYMAGECIAGRISGDDDNSGTEPDAINILLTIEADSPPPGAAVRVNNDINGGGGNGGNLSPFGPVRRADMSLLSEIMPNGGGSDFYDYTLLNDSDDYFSISDSRSGGSQSTVLNFRAGAGVGVFVLPADGIYAATIQIEQQDSGYLEVLTVYFESEFPENLLEVNMSLAINPDYASSQRVSILETSFTDSGAAQISMGFLGTTPPSSPHFAEMRFIDGNGADRTSLVDISFTIPVIDECNSGRIGVSNKLIVALSTEDFELGDCFYSVLYIDTRTGRNFQRFVNLLFSKVGDLAPRVSATIEANAAINLGGGDGTSESSPFGPVFGATSLAVITPSGGDGAGYTYSLFGTFIGDTSLDAFSISPADDGANATLVFQGNSLPNPDSLPAGGFYRVGIRVEEPDHIIISERIFNFETFFKVTTAAPPVSISATNINAAINPGGGDGSVASPIGAVPAAASLAVITPGGGAGTDYIYTVIDGNTFDISPADNGANATLVFRGNSLPANGLYSAVVSVREPNLAAVAEDDSYTILTLRFNVEEVVFTPVSATFTPNSDAAINADNGDGTASSPIGPISGTAEYLAEITPSGGDGEGYTYAVINDPGRIFNVAERQVNGEIALFFREGNIPTTGGIYAATISVREPTAAAFSVGETGYTLLTIHINVLSPISTSFARGSGVSVGGNTFIPLFYVTQRTNRGVLGRITSSGGAGASDATKYTYSITSDMNDYFKITPTADNTMVEISFRDGVTPTATAQTQIPGIGTIDSPVFVSIEVGDGVSTPVVTSIGFVIR